MYVYFVQQFHFWKLNPTDSQTFMIVKVTSLQITHCGIDSKSKGLETTQKTINGALVK